MFKRLTILAPGLLGGSLGAAARETRLAEGIIVWARRPEVREACSARAWCDGVTSTPEEAVKDADLVVVCTPVAAIAPLIKSIAPKLSPNAIVTDVGSTKSLVCRESARALDGHAIFVGSHPMAGSEKQGLEHSRANLFTHRPCLVTPLADTDPEAVEKVVRFWKGLEMHVSTLSPEKHDEVVAHISHLPHLLASALCVALASADSSWSAYAGAGLRDTTRVAAGSTPMWTAICEQNREEILRSLNHFEDALHQVKMALENQDMFQLQHLLEVGRKYRQTLGSQIESE